MNSTVTRASAAAAALVLATTLSMSAEARPAPVRAGVLSCHVSSGVGMLITSERGLNCVYHPVRGAAQHYVGTVRRFGLDIGVTGPGRMEWAVIKADPRRAGAGALSGVYAGASAAASIGPGLGANVLVGGDRHGFTLQPLSVEGQTGLALAAGVGELRLDWAGPMHWRHHRL